MLAHSRRKGYALVVTPPQEPRTAASLWGTACHHHLDVMRSLDMQARRPWGVAPDHEWLTRAADIHASRARLCAIYAATAARVEGLIK